MHKGSRYEMDIIMDKSLLFTVHGILLQGIRPITLRFQASRVSAKRGIKRYFLTVFRLSRIIDKQSWKMYDK